ncbi:MAG: hypothetical protein IKM82_05705 [Oscillospiraceae bacterium]|nr:hypothetical protein [Oscillospiraceae bacterium]MBR7075252.1 hypothetical protein [Oscillospiraceae bacterium]
MRNQILIRKTRVFDASAGNFSPACDILIKKGIVAEMATDIPCPPDAELVEGEGLCASVGWTDCHTHIEDFDPFFSYPSLGVTRIHDAGSFGAFTYHRFHDVKVKMPFPITTYLYVGVYGVANGELTTLDNIQEQPFLETAKAYPDEILGAKIRVDPRVNCDTKKSLRMAKELAVKANLPLIVHPSRCTDSVEEILAVMDKDDVYAHTYSPVGPCIFDENGRIKKAVWDAVERGVRFDLSHGSNNFEYDLARRAFGQGLITETISTDLHFKNYTRPGMDLAGVMTKAIHIGFTLEDALKRVILTPSELLHVEPKPTAIEVGQKADITAFTVSDEGVELPDSVRNVERCERNVQDVATVIGNSLYRSIEHAAEGPQYWKK